jgi:hypothetical protein
MKKFIPLLIMLATFSFAQSTQQKTVKMGQEFAIKTMKKAPSINGVIKSAKLIKAPEDIAKIKLPKRFSPKTYLRIELAISNVGKVKRGIWFNHSAIILEDKGISTVVGRPIRVTTTIAGNTSDNLPHRKITLEPNSQTTCTIIFALSIEPKDAKNLFFQVKKGSMKGKVKRHENEGSLERSALEF